MTSLGWQVQLAVLKGEYMYRIGQFDPEVRVTMVEQSIECLGKAHSVVRAALLTPHYHLLCNETIELRTGRPVTALPSVCLSTCQAMDDTTVVRWCHP